MRWSHRSLPGPVCPEPATPSNGKVNQSRSATGFLIPLASRSSQSAHMRRFIALILLIFSTTTPLEAVAGTLRDSEVHHETAAQATQHAARVTGEHGHEHDAASHTEDADTANEDHGPNHKHGTGADHCTHAHSPALSAGGADLTVVAISNRLPRLDVPVPSEHAVPPLHHPPRI